MILQLLLAVLGFLLSMWGIAAILMGLVGFILLPAISLVSRFKAFSRLFLRLATFPLTRVGIVVSESNDAYYKSMSLNPLGFHKTKIDGQTKVIEDPDQALHHWLGIRFGLVNEEHGVMFDPRHAAMGKRKKDYDDNGEDEFVATEDEWEQYDVSKWKPGVFEFPYKHELVDLSKVKQIIDGGERSEFADRVETLYEHSRDPFNEGTAATKFLYPVIAFAVTFGGIWFMSSQFGAPSGGSSSVSFGALFLLFSLSNGVDVLKEIDWRAVLAVFGLILLPIVPIVGLFVFTGLVTTIAVLVAFGIGFMILPFFTLLGQASTTIGGALSKLYMKLGLLGWKKPVFKWTPRKYELVEYDSLESTNDVEWYSMFGNLVGFTFEPDESSWGAEVETHSQLEAQVPVTDGGLDNSVKSNLPAKYVRSEEIGKNTDIYGGFIPKRISDRFYYINTQIALNRFAGTADGDKSLRKLLKAKEDHGSSNSGLDEGMVFKTTAVSGLFGAILGLGIFIIPAFL